MKAEFVGWMIMVGGEKEPKAYFRTSKEYKGRIIGYQFIECNEELADTLELGEIYDITETGELA